MSELADPSNLQIGALVTGLGGGMALFLFGMRQMTESLKTVAGGSMKTLLGKLTANRYTAALAGMIVTAVIQSSSVTTVLIVGFISAGLLSLSQSIGVIVGANVGTTITAQIIAFQVYKYGLLMIAVGFLTDIVAKTNKGKQWGMALMGLGLIFFGMELMSNATGPLRAWPPFIDAMQNMKHPLLAIAIGAVFTAIVQSSSATTGIVIVLASQGMISLESGIGLCFGANIGTCVTAILSAMGRSREAIQAAWVHVIFNAGGVLLWMFFIYQFADLVRAISPVSSGLDDAARVSADTPRQIANAHTLFNVGNAFLFIWFTGPMAKLVNWLVPERPEEIGMKAKFLDEQLLEQPSLALDQTRRELVRLGVIVSNMLGSSMGVALQGKTEDIQRIASLDDDVDLLYGQIITYLAKLSQQNLIDPQPKMIHEFVGIANYLENIGDVMDKEMLVNARKRISLGFGISPSTVAVLNPIEQEVIQAQGKTMTALETGDRQSALDAIESKERVNQLSDVAAEHLAKRLVADEPNRLATYKLETDLIENLKRINTLTRRIARLVLIEEGSSNVGETLTEIADANSKPDEPSESVE
ncbi:Na/Pi cotransporter family protein [Mariniblastus fucicola]|uniref:Na+/Pi-cotransporter n=1 Tax=Mariniblastus fucicola TaxID=980251 RepID=A0A5B9P8M1_9BACT|nr:Na/Pi cotransporter family protein [Mariniblastus fucicola]QEG22638.1 Na+/Pi-cotransporter [Mariniblastus fucicola]